MSYVITRGLIPADDCATYAAYFNSKRWDSVYVEGERSCGVQWLEGVMSLAADVRGAMRSLDGHIQFEEQPQIARYEVDEFFATHADNDSSDYVAMDRTMTAVLLLHAAEEGGELFVDGDLVRMSPGDLVVFRSSTPHRVSRVLAGMRMTLTQWGK